eukprot:723429-Alexandrium_andersonii.AAC.1
MSRNFEYVSFPTCIVSGTPQFCQFARPPCFTEFLEQTHTPLAPTAWKQVLSAATGARGP